MPEDARPEGKIAAVIALAKGGSTSTAAQAAGVNDRTVRRWLEDDAFRRDVHRLRGDLLDQTAGALVEAAVEAVATLRASLDAESEQVRVRAANVILNAVIAIRDTSDFEQRLADLEAGSKNEGPLS